MMPREITIKATIYEPDEAPHGDARLTWTRGRWNGFISSNGPVLGINRDDIPPYIPPEEPKPEPLPNGFYPCHWAGFRTHGTSSVIRDAVCGEVLVERNCCRNTTYTVFIKRHGSSHGWLWRFEPVAQQETSRLIADACAQSLGGWKEA